MAIRLAPERQIHTDRHDENKQHDQCADCPNHAKGIGINARAMANSASGSAIASAGAMRRGTPKSTSVCWLPLRSAIFAIPAIIKMLVRASRVDRSTQL
jgi:hypothetical protein